ncbi:hypothetical protein C0Z01_19135 [Photobacterium kishitanii]|uniref:Uncharacterized protein n=1 Tax=Photobacterium kishitanii TaxID=318456 RepID=A0A2T3KKK1_9GAMM|nr:hypothetical protein [Photobacterium kishitanii]KJG10997.1 hypothetical protein UB40_06710 [Photobacterium kishitanii]KJG60002.1 hypothetical protein UA38_02445 [Photobacterium kishitanii]KJG63285.1 hypothetical protein UA42_02830 [Photobacterium kishitanii]KJG67708.1 hypothetical protein UA40_00010 [Photobacterium kishitanii]KJG71455.1 hypothetical protein UA41_02465 [Photobacterium kishitanii]
MSYIRINRLPTDRDVEKAFGLEIHSFTEAFNMYSVAPFVAEVGFKSSYDDNGQLWERYHLGGWALNKDAAADWFTFVDEYK